MELRVVPSSLFFLSCVSLFFPVCKIVTDIDRGWITMSSGEIELDRERERERVSERASRRKRDEKKVSDWKTSWLPNGRFTFQPTTELTAWLSSFCWLELTICQVLNTNFEALFLDQFCIYGEFSRAIASFSVRSHGLTLHALICIRRFNSAQKLIKKRPPTPSQKHYLCKAHQDRVCLSCFRLVCFCNLCWCHWRIEIRRCVRACVHLSIPKEESVSKRDQPHDLSFVHVCSRKAMSNWGDGPFKLNEFTYSTRSERLRPVGCFRSCWWTWGRRHKYSFYYHRYCRSCCCCCYLSVVLVVGIALASCFGRGTKRRMGRHEISCTLGDDLNKSGSNAGEVQDSICQLSPFPLWESLGNLSWEAMVLLDPPPTGFIDWKPFLGYQSPRIEKNQFTYGLIWTSANFVPLV